MKVKTRKQLLVLLLLVNFVVFFVAAIVCKYYFDLDIVGPLMGTAAVMALLQYNLRKNQLPEA